MIVRGTTTHHTFLLPEFGGTIQKVYVTYSQKNTEIITKEYTNSDIISREDGNQLVVSLSQTDTLSFSYCGIPSKDAISIQLRVLTNDEEAYSSNIIIEQVGKSLKEGVISGESIQS